MVSKRKNKKPAGNPARGFATTSTASKAKSSSDVATEKTISETAAYEHNVPQDQNNNDIPTAKELHQLNPEELEKQLEEYDLNLLHERNGEKVKRDVSRQINKLQTEKRLVRAQAEVLQTRSWLPPEIMELILHAIEDDRSMESQKQRVTGNIKSDELSEDDLALKLWTLKQVLVRLGFPRDRSEEALQYLLLVVREPTVHERLEGRDSIWGLDYCLDWLALHCEDHEVPQYLPRQEKTEAMPVLEQHQGNGLPSERSDNGELAPLLNRRLSPC